TGLFSGNSGIPHIQRFDREKWRAIDYLSVSDYRIINDDLINLRALSNPSVANLDAPTSIFELLKGYPTAAVYSSFYKGAKTVLPGVPIKALWSAYISGREEHVDVLAYKELSKLFKADRYDIPRYTMVGLYSSDISGHKYGPDSKQVQEVLVQFDIFLKDFVDQLKKQGLADKTYIIVTADHGMHKTGKLFKLQKGLEDKGFTLKPKSPNDNKYTIFAAGRGVASSHLYIKRDGVFKPLDKAELLRKVPARWGEPTDLINTILAMDATEFLVVRNGERNARLFNHDGKSADINCFNIDYTEYCSYIFDPLLGDPLGYSSNEKLRHLLDGRPHSSLEWKKATADEVYPDAVVNFAQIFFDSRGGDAFMTIRAPYGLRTMKKGNHGGIIDQDMRVPFMVSGPTVPKGKFNTARPMDIYALLVEWFGFHISSKSHDGVNPFRTIGHENMDQMRLASMEQIFSKNPPIFKMIDVPRFVIKEVSPTVSTSHFGRLIPLAKKEMKRRLDVLNGISGYLDSLMKQKNDEAAPYVVDKRYLNDHIDIAKRNQEHVRRGMMVMEDIHKILRNCRAPHSHTCQGL
ncbi:MAG: sulfatase-like hydrolase/transferase, partial [Deltaproteobacteria bacterium]|nr:sulfatase-like hydrolase/transferase [Deltaproteobacteria bacterium]